MLLEPRELQNFWNVHLEGLAEASLSLGWRIRVSHLCETFRRGYFEFRVSHFTSEV